VWVPGLKPGGLAHPFKLSLNVPLAERPPTVSSPRLGEQEIHLPSSARLQPLLFKGHHVGLQEQEKISMEAYTYPGPLDRSPRGHKYLYHIVASELL